MENLKDLLLIVASIIFVFSLPISLLLYKGAKLLKNQIIDKFKK